MSGAFTERSAPPTSSVALLRTSRTHPCTNDRPHPRDVPVPETASVMRGHPLVNQRQTRAVVSSGRLRFVHPAQPASCAGSSTGVRYAAAMTARPCALRRQVGMRDRLSVPLSFSTAAAATGCEVKWPAADNRDFAATGEAADRNLDYRPRRQGRRYFSYCPWTV